MNLLQGLALLTVIVLPTRRSTLKGKAKVRGGGSPIWEEVFYLGRALETDDSALSPRLQTPQCVFPLFVSLLCIRLNTHLRLNGC